MQDESLAGARGIATEARLGPLRAGLAACLAALAVPACVDSQKGPGEETVRYEVRLTAP